MLSVTTLSVTTLSVTTLSVTTLANRNMGHEVPWSIVSKILFLYIITKNVFLKPNTVYARICIKQIISMFSIQLFFHFLILFCFDKWTLSHTFTIADFHRHHTHSHSRTVKNLQQDVQSRPNTSKHVQTHSKIDFLMYCRRRFRCKTPWPSAACLRQHLRGHDDSVMPKKMTKTRFQFSKSSVVF